MTEDQMAALRKKLEEVTAEPRPKLIPFATTTLDCEVCHPEMHTDCRCRARCTEHRSA